MNIFVVYLALALLGLVFGSFAGASVWRLRARQLETDKSDGEHVDKAEYEHLKKLTKKSIVSDRSQCLNCSYLLRWYDLIPLLSWLLLGGRCRKCHKPIGYFEPLIEIAVATFFVLSYAFWPYHLDNYLEITRLVLWLISGVGLAVLFAYDKKWSLLPDKINFAIISIGAMNALVVVLLVPDKISALLSLLGAIFILSGIYYVIYLISRGMWIGFGDIKLGLGLALLLADWRLAFIALFAANLIGCLIVLPAMAIGKLKRGSHVPFGPLLIAGFVFAGLAGNYIISLYFSSLT